ncbi:hypothetical protein SMACR_07838 [Sordaria macrospora]|uniref:Uncharacterized protein n=1 Tax=Sordaria macrospora TaxID=5147 RepID=A0A8S8ZTI9_SORMA|nr:hypothetical protein SMACR_07838 [Sordaria macrospora]KAH7633825.1 hypothetical protein B0T09DRAFT_334713 [Sordaria sp. MPI-SDFR-AT-0083]WPJ59805.1 hypothetical protein SMAC4_07838 [Sordaria macrospora]
MQTPKSKLRGRTVGGTCIRNQQSLCRTSFDTSQNINEYNQTKSSKRKATTPNRFFSNTSNINTTEMSTQSKADKIEEVRKNLPLPEQPPVASDWQSADERNVNVSSGRFSGDVSNGPGVTSGLREPTSSDGANIDMSNIGKGEKDNKSS